MQWSKPITYAVKHKQNDVIEQSRSGGIFTALSDYVFEQGGIVYGSVLDDTFHVRHVRADCKDLRNKMRGSKYVQSDMGDVLQQVREDLKQGKQVLFTGTSCQIAGLKGFLGQEQDNLTCVDIVCHGVPSPLVWQYYLEWQKSKVGRKIIGINFRNKQKFGWAAHYETIYFEDNMKIDSDVFKNLFMGHMMLRPSCYECPYKSIIHPGDITIADYWGINQAAPSFDDNKGTSLVLINNEKGEKFFQQVLNDLIYEKTSIEKSMQPPLVAPFPKPTNREQFWKDLKNRSFYYVARTYGGYGLINKVKRKLKRLVKVKK